MSHEQLQARRASGGQAAFAAAIPRAPPLPAPRPLQRARDAASRFLGYPSRPTSPQDERDGGRFAPKSGRLDRYASLGATQNATVSHKTGLEINTIAINEKGTHALIGGKEIFKTVKIEDGKCAEDFNLRTAIRSTPTHASGLPRLNYSIDIADVAWAKGDCGNFVAAATSSGKIILYDLGHAGLQHAQLHEHFRQVHKVTFNPHKGNLLLSGSQDGTVRLWDLRDARGQASTVQSKRKFSGQSDGVRDVKWSPTEGLDFAFGTDNGEIQRWDMRNLKAPKVRIPAHILACNSIDWHPDGAHIISASSDKSVRVFDLSGSRHRKASWEIKTPYPVMNARWRPSCESSMPRDYGARQCTQIVTSYDREHPVMHIWDFRRPHLPFRMMEPYPWAPTDLLWHSQDLLWTVGREGIFLQTDVHHVPKVIERRNLQAAAVSATGELTAVAQTRKERRTHKHPPIPSPLTKTSSSLSASPDSNFLSRSWADDSLDHSFLSVEASKRHARSGSHGRTFHTPSTTQAPTIKLDDIMLNRQSFRPQQFACRGSIPSYNNIECVTLVAENSVLNLSRALQDEEFITKLTAVFNDNASLAEEMGNFPLCQAWKLASLWTVKHLRRRLDLKRTQAAASRNSLEHRLPSTALETMASRLAAQHLKSSATSPASMRPLSNQAHPLAIPESTSNVPTPLARPTTSSKPPVTYHPPLPDLDKEDPITLPPSLTSTVPESHQHISRVSRPAASRSITDNRLTAGNLHDLDSLQSTDRNDMVRRWSSQPRVPLNLEPLGLAGVAIPPRLEKHDSAESFKFLEGSTDSRVSSFPASVASAGSGAGGLVSAHPSRLLTRTKPTAKEPEATNSSEDQSAAKVPLLFDGSGTLASSASEQAPTTAKIRRNSQNVVEEDREVSNNGGEHVNATGKGFRPGLEFEENLEVLQRRSAALENAAQIDATHQDHMLNHQKIAPSIISTQAISAMALNEHPLKPDYIHDEQDIDLEEGNPFTLVELLQELLRQHTVVEPYPQVASILLFLLGPLLPRTHPLPAPVTYQTIACYVDYFYNQLNWNPDEIPSLVRDSFSQPFKAGLQPMQVESILSTYHEQLLSQSLFDQAAHLRKLAFPAYPAVYEDFLKDNAMSFKCGHCSKAMPLSSLSRLRCELCDRRPERCPVCWLSRSPFEPPPPPAANPAPAIEPAPRSSLFTSCLLCNHAAHAACLGNWFHDAGGTGCPTEGCLCDCVAGAWREEKARILERMPGSSTAQGSIRKDDWMARESRAVEVARATLTGRGLGNREAQGGNARTRR